MASRSRESGGSGRVDTSGLSVSGPLAADPGSRDAGLGIAVVRSGRSGRSDGPRHLASTADDGTTGSPFGGCRSVGYSPEDSARDADRRLGRPGDTDVAGVGRGSGSSGEAATTVAPDETEQRSDNQ
jgi:hypothetical protein